MIGTQYYSQSLYTGSLQSQPARGVVTPSSKDSATALNQQESNSQSNSQTRQATQNTQPSSFQGSVPANGVSESQSSQKVESEFQIQQVLSQLKARDQEVRAHEMAHLSAAGSFARGGMSFTYQTGPDGKRYAIGGEVGIDVSPVAGDPQASLQKAMQIQRAALAPAQPSAQDMRVASAASQMMVEAQQQIREQQLESASEDSSDTEQDEMQISNEIPSISEEGSDSNNSNMLQERNQFAVRMQINNVSDNELSPNRFAENGLEQNTAA